MKTRVWTVASVIIWTLTGSGCAAVRYVPAPLEAPPRPVLPRIEAERLQCLDDATYRALVERDRLRREYAERLEALIESTQEEK